MNLADLIDLGAAAMRTAWYLLYESSVWLLIGLLAAGLARTIVGRRWPKWPGFALAVVSGLVSPETRAEASGLRLSWNAGARAAHTVSAAALRLDGLALVLAFLGPYCVAAVVVAGLAASVLAGAGAAIGGRTADVRPVSPVPEEPASRPNAFAECIGFAYIRLVSDVARWFVLGLVAAGVIHVLLDFQAGPWPLSTHAEAFAVMMVLGFVLQIRLAGSAPVAGMLVLAGLPAGPAVAFMVTGAASGAARNSRLRETLGVRGWLLAMALAGAGGVAAGAGFDVLASREGWTTDARSWAAIGPVGFPEAVFVGASTTLVVLLFIGIFKEILDIGRGHARYLGETGSNRSS